MWRLAPSSYYILSSIALVSPLWIPRWTLSSWRDRQAISACIWSRNIYWVIRKCAHSATFCKLLLFCVTPPDYALFPFFYFFFQVEGGYTGKDGRPTRVHRIVAKRKTNVSSPKSQSKSGYFARILRSLWISRNFRNRSGIWVTLDVSGKRGSPRIGGKWTYMGFLFPYEKDKFSFHANSGGNSAYIA